MNITKNLIFWIIYIMIICVFVCLFGFIIGGYPSIWFFTLIGFVSLLLMIFWNKKFIKIEKIISIIIICATLIAANQIYIFTNNAFDSKEYKSAYTTELYTYEGKNTIYDYGMYFKDPYGIEKFKNSSFIEEYDDGDIVLVEEYSGLFGIEHYKFYKTEEIS